MITTCLNSGADLREGGFLRPGGCIWGINPPPLYRTPRGEGKSPHEKIRAGETLNYKKFANGCSKIKRYVCLSAIIHNISKLG